MQLLVSVSDADEARAALAGGADWIDAKDPAAGPLGPVTPDVFAAIAAAVAGRAPLSAALGDVVDASTAHALAASFAGAGASIVKVGVGLCADGLEIGGRVRGAVEGVRATGASGQPCQPSGACRVIAVLYADARPWALIPGRVIAALQGTGAAGVLIDTADKHGPGLLGCLDESMLRAWQGATHAAGLDLALAGRLSSDDVARLARLDLAQPLASVVGVRGAACDGGRTGRVSAARVSELRACLRPVPAGAGSPR